MKKEFNWKKHISALNDFPLLIQQWEKDFVKAIRDNIPKNEIKKVLEVGCSNGRWLRWFIKEYSCEAYGVDSNSAGFEKGDINFKIGDAFNLPYRNESFDLVFSIGFIEHFLKKEISLILKEQCRVLKKGGFLICQIPNLNFSLEYFYVKYVYDYKQGYRHFIITHNELKKYLKELELKIIDDRFLGFFFERFGFLGRGKGVLKLVAKSNLFKTEYLVIARRLA